MTAPSYHFRRATAADMDLLARWQRRPHVAQWWGSDDYSAEDFIATPDFTIWIVEAEGAPFAFMQDYDVHVFGPDHHFYHLPPGSRGIDQYIGEPAMVGKGHGTRFMRQRMDALYAAGAPVIGTDPHPDNARAIAVYRKLGFFMTGGPQETPWGRVILMEASRPGTHPI